MKTIRMFLVSAIMATSSFGDSLETLSSNSGEYWANGKLLDAIHEKVWITRQAELNGESIQLNLIYYHEKSANNAELRLVGQINGQKLILWWADIGQTIPSEFVCEISSNRQIAGLCFKCLPRMFIFYEIDLKKAAQEALASNYRVTPSAWLFGNPLHKPNDCRQEVRLHQLPNMVNNDESFYVKDLKLLDEDERWIFSFDVKGIPTETRYYYQYPVGGTGLTFVKKEPVPQESPNVKICNETLASIYYSKIGWAARHDKNPGDLVDTNSFYKEMFKGKEPKCPDGGIYDIGPVGTMPKCSIHGIFKE